MRQYTTAERRGDAGADPAGFLREIVGRIPATGEVLLVLDKDGTLDPFVDDPSEAVTPYHVRDDISRLAGAGVDVAVVSGRSVEQLRPLVGEMDITYLGQHGNEKYKGGSATYQRRPPSGYAGEVDGFEGLLRGRLREAGLDGPGVILERKGESLAVHWRRAPGLGQRVTEVFRGCAEESGLLASGRFALQPGSMVLELKPKLYDKGSAVEELVKERSYKHVVCVGDDLTDLSMMEAVKNLGVPSTIIVIDSRIRFPGAYVLPSPEVFHGFLDLLADRRGAARDE